MYYVSAYQVSICFGHQMDIYQSHEVGVALILRVFNLHITGGQLRAGRGG